MKNKEILIYAELTRGGKLANVVLELASKAGELAEKLDNALISAVLISDERDIEEIKMQLENIGFDKVYIVQNSLIKNYSTEIYLKIVLDLIKKVEPEIILIGATTQGRDLAPAMATNLNTGLTADCTALDINEEGKLAATRPTFGGNLMATILCKNLPQMATVRPKIFKKSDKIFNKNTEFQYIPTDLKNIDKKVNIIEFIPFNEVNGIHLDEAEIIVSGGRGMKSLEGFQMLQDLAALLNGTVGASRGAVDLGLADSSVQIGQTGKSVMPKVYIACGISGAVHHLVGMSGADKIIAINKDVNAPIFKIADIGIVGDVFEIIPELIKKIKNRG